jgi:hypothetical protein
MIKTYSEVKKHNKNLERQEKIEWYEKMDANFALVKYNTLHCK